MGRHYTKSTIDVVGDLHNGLHVETSVYDCLVYWLGLGGPVQLELFNVFGRILLLQLFCEMTEIQGGGATLIQFNATFATPPVGVQPISAASVAVTNLAVGSRVVWQGGAIASIPQVTVVAVGGISDVFPPARQIIGTVGGIGTIGHIPSIADTITTGEARANLFYVPLSDDAYVTPAF